MSRGGLLVLIVLLAAAISVVVWIGRRAAPPPVAESEPPLVKAFESDAVREIDLSCGATALTLARAPSGGWRITRPIDAEADPRQVRTLLESVRDASVKKVITADASHLESFGLAPAACTIRLRFLPEAPPATLRLGRVSPIGSERYAAADDGRVVLTDGNLFGVVSRDAEAFREKRLFPVEPAEISGITLDRPGGRVVARRSGGSWRLEAPTADLASASACESLARALTELSFVDSATVPVPTDIKPERRTRVEASTTGGAPFVAYVATAGIEGKRLAWRDGASRAGLVGEATAAELERPADALRDLRIVSLSTPDIRKLTLSQGASTLRIERAGEASPWSGTAGTATFAVDAHRVDELLDQLRGLSASGFASGAGSEKSGTLVVEGPSGTLASLTWGTSGADLWVTTPSRPGVVFHVGRGSFGPVPTQASEWGQPSHPAAKAGSGS